MKKVASIGDSVTSYSQTGQNTNHWSYLLAEKYPQHTYRNYGLGGRGPDYFQWALLDAKIWGASVVFLGNTYSSRSSLLIDSPGHEELSNFDWHSSDTPMDNYKYLLPGFSHIWASRGTPNLSVQGYKDPTQVPKSLQNFTNEYNVMSAMSSTRDIYEQLWYENAEKLYDFEYFHFLDFNKIRKLIDGPGYPHNIQYHISDKDSHWNKEGNIVVFEKYIFTEKVRSSLDN